MSNIKKVLGQSALSAATPANLYTVPADTQAVLSDIVFCNRSATATKIRLSVRPAGAVQADQHYIAYDLPIAGNETLPLQLGITLAPTDVLTAYAELATVSVSAFGYEEEEGQL